jgi:hypothetical protein
MHQHPDLDRRPAEDRQCREDDPPPLRHAKAPPPDVPSARLRATPDHSAPAAPRSARLGAHAKRRSNSQLYHYFAQTDQITAGHEPLLNDALKSWRDMLVELQRRRHCRGGCPLGSLSRELAETDEAARIALASGFARWEMPIRNGLRRMQQRGELRSDTDVDALALSTLVALQGGLLVTQAMLDPSPLEAGLNLAIAQIRAHTRAEAISSG